MIPIELELSSLTINALRNLFSKVRDGGLDEVGAKLVGCLQRKLGKKFDPSDALTQPANLQEVILSELKQDLHFRTELESLLREYQAVAKTADSSFSGNTTINQNNTSGPSIGINNNSGSQSFFR